MNLRQPSWLLRLESVALAVTAVALYARHDGSWLLFALLILAPDLSMLGYLGGNRFGALSYNLAHVFAGPATLALIELADSSLATSVALIWSTHILVDRALGYGLKYDEGFKFTHLDRV